MFFLLEDDCPAERLCPVDWTLSTTCRFHRVVCFHCLFVAFGCLLKDDYWRALSTTC